MWKQQQQQQNKTKQGPQTKQNNVVIKKEICDTCWPLSKFTVTSLKINFKYLMNNDCFDLYMYDIWDKICIFNHSIYVGFEYLTLYLSCNISKPFVIGLTNKLSMILANQNWCKKASIILKRLITTRHSVDDHNHGHEDNFSLKKIKNKNI